MAEPLILPESIRLLQPQEVPDGEEYAQLRAGVARGQVARFTAGYVLVLPDRSDFSAYSEINAHAPRVWSLVRDLSLRLLPEQAALLIGSRDEKPHSCPYRDKRVLLDAIEPYGEALARDCFVEFGFIWQRAGMTDEVFVHAARWIAVWTTRPRDLEAVLRDHGIPAADSLSFLDEFPHVTSPTHHAPGNYRHEELIRRVLAADAELPAAERFH